MLTSFFFVNVRTNKLNFYSIFFIPYLNHFTFKKIPLCVWDMVDLECLNLQRNQLMTLSSRISNFYKLRYLYLDNNLLEELPFEIVEVEELEILGSANNQLREIPWTIQDLTKLHILDLQYNPHLLFDKDEWHQCLPNCEIYI